MEGYTQSEYFSIDECEEEDEEEEEEEEFVFKKKGNTPIQYSNILKEEDFIED